MKQVISIMRYIILSDGSKAGEQNDESQEAGRRRIKADDMYILKEDLKLNDWQYSQRKFLPYEIKLKLSRQRIEEWYENWGGDVYLSYSGGLDSTVLLHMIRQYLFQTRDWSFLKSSALPGKPGEILWRSTQRTERGTGFPTGM